MCIRDRTWEQEYETAPEKKTLTEEKPVAGNPFDCIAQMPDDSQYYYKISSTGPDTLSVKIKKAANKGGEDVYKRQSYNGKIMYGSREIPNLTWRMYHRISFKDGTADVYIYEGTADRCV